MWGYCPACGGIAPHVGVLPRMLWGGTRHVGVVNVTNYELLMVNLLLTLHDTCGGIAPHVGVLPRMWGYCPACCGGGPGMLGLLMLLIMNY
jgi:hypothetical protein